MPKELFDQPLIESPDLPDNDERITFGLPSVSGGKNMKWGYFKTAIGGFDPQQTILVSQTDGDYSNIKDALDSITDNSPTKRYTILVAPGVYTEDNSSGAIALKDYCNVSAIGIRSVIVIPVTPANDLFSGGIFTHLIGLLFSGNTGTAYILRHAAAGSTYVQNCVFRDCANGIIMTGASSILEARNNVFNNPATTTTTNGIVITGGKANILDITFRSTSIVTTCISVSGSVVQVSLSNMIAISPDITTAIKAFDGCHLVGGNNSIGYIYDGLIIYGNDTIVQFDACKIQYAQNDGFRIDNTGTGIELSLFATTVIDCTSLNFNVLNGNCTVLGNGYTAIKDSYVHPDASFYAYLLDVTPDDEGLNVIGELHVGTPEKPGESVFGEGDSYGRGMLVYTYNGSVYVDVSEDARSSSGSTFTFPNINVNTAIYVATSLQQSGDYLKHYGIKSKVDTAGVLGSGEIVCEYWNGSAWTEINIMEAESSGDYMPNAKNLFEDTGSHQIRYDSELSKDSWAKNDPITPAVGTDLYWVRFRIATAITTAPILEQFKVHSNRMEINADGWVEYFGKARPIGQLPVNMSFGNPFEGSMQSQTLYTSQDVGVGGSNNKFTATGDKLGMSGFLPFDCDTSSPLKVQWAGHPNLTGTYGWTIRWAWITEGDGITYAEPGAPITNSGSMVISKAATLDQLAIFEAELDISKLVSRRTSGYGDELWISIQPTTLPGNFSLGGSQITYTKWCEGGHI